MKTVLLLMLAVSLLYSCKKSDDTPDYSGIYLVHEVTHNNESFQDSAGNWYAVHTDIDTTYRDTIRYSDRATQAIPFRHDLFTINSQGKGHVWYSGKVLSHSAEIFFDGESVLYTLDRWYTNNQYNTSISGKRIARLP